MIYWCYQTIVIPRITYASVVWWSKAQQITAQQKLQKVQRLICLSITGSMKTCPTAAMELILGLPPLHLQIREEATKGAIRAQKIYNYFSGDLTGHMRILNDQVVQRITSAVSDEMPTIFNFE